jgi:mycoredoxin
MHAVDVVVVYYKPGCPYSAMLFAKLKLRGVPYTAVRFQDDPQGARKGA